MGIAAAFLKEIIHLAEERSLTKIWLTVNKHNKGSIEAYKKMGFKITGDMITDIGCGYYMDDHVMEYEIGRKQ
jgi:RimJ/RimL family protein N-acetyltransferase